MRRPARHHTESVVLRHLTTGRALSSIVLASVVCVAAAPVAASGQAVYEVIAGFSPPTPDGQSPSALVHATDGTFYGTTVGGGSFGAGTVFKIDAAGVVTTVYSFDGLDRGGFPGILIQGSDGNLYGTTSVARFGPGAIFKIDPSGTLSPIGVSCGPQASLSQGSDGNLYAACAVTDSLHKLDPRAPCCGIQLHSFTPGSSPTGVIQATDGTLYGTTRYGGATGRGTVFRIDAAGMLTTLHHFGSSVMDGEEPESLIQGRDGLFYGTTRSGGHGFGTVFRIHATGTLETLHAFTSTEGGSPVADLVEASDGSFYGTTQQPATLFRIDAAGTLTTLHTFSGSDGDVPGGLILGQGGRFYGITALGGVNGGGTIFTFDGIATLSTLHEFSGYSGGVSPFGVIQGSDGRLYGTTSTSGNNGISGTVFTIEPGGPLITLHRFSSPLFTSVGVPSGRLIEALDGSFYGTTYTEFDSAIPPGMIFRITSQGELTRLTSGSLLRSGIIQTSDGSLYGTRSASARAPVFGSVFKIDPAGGLTTLHQFRFNEDTNPGPLTQVSDGSFYGTTDGLTFQGYRGLATVFRIDPAGVLTTLHTFSGPDGASPKGRLIQASDGSVYGTTSAGGAFGYGTVFRLDAAGGLTTLYHFAGSDGANPYAGLVQGDDGRLFGTTGAGGALGYGTVFVIDPAGTLTTLHNFAMTDGAYPGELIQARDGNFYGTASSGGPSGGGVVFRFRLPTPTSTEYYEIVSRHSGQCLDVYGAATEDVAAVIQWRCHGGANQQWRLEPVANGAVRLVARHSGKALDVFWALVDDLAPAIQYTWHGGENQQWMLEPDSDGYMRIVARHSGKVLDVTGASLDEGTPVIQYTAHGGTNQQWLLRAIETRAP